MAVQQAPAEARIASPPSQLDLKQTTNACTVLLKHIKKQTKLNNPKPDLLAAEDGDQQESQGEGSPIWLVLTTKKHIVEQKRLKPVKVPLPHSIHASSTSSICLITADPSTPFTALIGATTFPAHLRSRIARTISLSNLKKNYSTYESKRALYASHDIFLADDRIITYLPGALGKIFYKGGSKRPIPVKIAAGRERGEDGERVKIDPANGKKMFRTREDKEATVQQPPAAPEVVAKEIEEAVGCALIHLSPGTNTAVKIARADMSVEQVVENLKAVTNELISKFVTRQWDNIRAIHVKGQETASFPIWLASQLWTEEGDVLEQKPAYKRKVAAEEAAQAEREERFGDPNGEISEDDLFEDPETDNPQSVKRKAEEIGKAGQGTDKHAKKRRAVEVEDKLAAESKKRKAAFQQQKSQTAAQLVAS